MDNKENIHQIQDIPLILENIQKIFENISNDFNLNGCLTDIQTSFDENKSLDGMFISGGATRFIGLAISAIEAIKMGYKPDIIGGISSGALLALPMVLGKYNEIISAGLSVRKRNFFKVPPTTEKGGISWQGIFRALFGHYSFGIQDVPSLLQKYISEKEFELYQNDKYPDILIMAVNANTGQQKFWNIKDKNCVDYKKYLDIVAASCAIPIMTQAIYVDGLPYFDGGMRNHIPSAALMSKYKFNKTLSIYSRPQQFIDIDDKWKNNIIAAIWRTIRVMSIAISKSDEMMESLIGAVSGTKMCKIFLPDVLSSLYATDELDDLATASKIVAREQLKGFI